MRKSLWIIALLSLFAAVGAPSALAQTTFGLSFDDNGTVEGCSGLCSTNAPGVNVQLPGATSYSDNFSLSLDGGTSTFNASISNGEIHAYSQTVVNPLTSSANGADLWWSDTFKALGPAGQTGAFRIDLTFHGTATNTLATGADAGDLVNELGLTTGPIGSCIGPSCGLAFISGLVPSFDQTVSTIVDWSAGTGLSYQLTTGLLIRNDIRDVTSTPSEGVTLDESNTASYTITPLTPGFSYSSASGLTYPPMSATPEPGTSILWLTGIVLMIVMRKRIAQILDTGTHRSLSHPAHH